MRLIVSTMKDEGPFILEWIAYYQFLGFDHFIINTNDCSDGTDAIIKRLQELDIATHIDNPGPWPKGPQASAYRNAMAHPRYQDAEWVMTCDADEFLDIKVGDYTLDSLFAATPKTDVYPFVWRLFGHSGITEYEDRFIIEQMTMAAPLRQTWPPQVRAFKSLVRANGTYKTISTHRPKGLRLRRGKNPRWTDGDGQRIYGFENQGWLFCRSGNGFGTELARMNHYAVRSLDSYMMKRQRGDVNTTSFHSKMEASGERYWQLHCWNVVHEPSMQSKLAAVKGFYEKLRSDPVLNELHLAAVDYHKEKIAAIRQTPHARDFAKRNGDYRSGTVVTIADEAIVDPSQALNRSHFDPDTFLKVSQAARFNDMAARKGTKKLPWFANLDALETVKHHETCQEIASACDAQNPDSGALPDLPSSLLRLVHQEFGPRNRRQERISSQRKVFLDQVSGGRRAKWLLLGGADQVLIEDILARREVKKLIVVEPWGIRPKEMVVDAIKTDNKRKTQDAAFFHCVMQRQADIKSGRLTVIRSMPQWVVRLFDDACFDIVFVNGARNAKQSYFLLEQIARKLKPEGLTILNSYREKDAAGLGTIQALHSFLGKHPQDWRVMGTDNNHIAIEALGVSGLHDKNIT